jgi:hypothetical protein
MRIEQATAPHRIIHFPEPGHRYHKTENIRFKIGTYGGIEEADKGTPASSCIFNNRLCDDSTATGTEQGSISIMLID